MRASCMSTAVTPILLKREYHYSVDWLQGRFLSLSNSSALNTYFEKNWVGWVGWNADVWRGRRQLFFFHTLFLLLMHRKLSSRQISSTSPQTISTCSTSNSGLSTSVAKALTSEGFIHLMQSLFMSEPTKFWFRFLSKHAFAVLSYQKKHQTKSDLASWTFPR